MLHDSQTVSARNALEYIGYLTTRGKDNNAVYANKTKRSSIIICLKVLCFGLNTQD